ncbi:hypothetical protein [Streptomyces sp. NPDC001292]|uniref:hypothetical protein n=1 Tax=Streptomyces sp. NPDC001292 TaxID=3364558 RepID=UPI0036A474AC
MPVAKVTILPSGPAALGAIEQLPGAERYSESYQPDLPTVRLGGRAGEPVVFG